MVTLNEFHSFYAFRHKSNSCSYQMEEQGSGRHTHRRAGMQIVGQGWGSLEQLETEEGSPAEQQAGRTPEPRLGKEALPKPLTEAQTTHVWPRIQAVLLQTEQQ